MDIFLMIDSLETFFYHITFGMVYSIYQLDYQVYLV